MSLQNTHFLKWSNGVERVEMDILWCISMTNNVKSCKNNQWKFSNGQLLCFYKGTSVTSGALLKKLSTRKTKTPISQFFPILWPIKGGTMSRCTARAFRKCVTYGGGDDLIHSYGPSKSVQISIIFSVGLRCPKKQHSSNFVIWGLKRIEWPMGLFTAAICFESQIFKIGQVLFFFSLDIS